MVEHRCFLFHCIIASETCGSNPQIPINPGRGLDALISTADEAVPNNVGRICNYEKYFTDYC